MNPKRYPAELAILFSPLGQPAAVCRAHAIDYVCQVAAMEWKLTIMPAPAGCCCGKCWLEACAFGMMVPEKSETPGPQREPRDTGADLKGADLVDRGDHTIPATHAQGGTSDE